MCRIDDGDPCDIFSTRTIKGARKEHSCAECGRSIRVGESYEYSFWVYDGTGWSAHTCSHCKTLYAWLDKNCGGHLVSEAKDEIREHIEEYPKLAGDLRPLLEGVRRKWSDGYESVQPIPRGISDVYPELRH